MSGRVFEVAQGFGGTALPGVAHEDALHRVQVFCTQADSGWITYDLAGHLAREAGHFTSVGHWSMLYAQALAGQITISNVAAFTRERRPPGWPPTRDSLPCREIRDGCAGIYVARSGITAACEASFIWPRSSRAISTVHLVTSIGANVLKASGIRRP
jgi:hypothetical protein